MNTIPTQPGSKAVSIWIYIGVAMILIQVVLGGVTRLTGSGLSITEWNLKHLLPPLTQQEWLGEFQKYKATPQFRFLNMDFTLEDFKSIFFWEWLHRTWAKLLGFVFLGGFVYLIAKKYLRKQMIKPLLILFLFGLLQAVIGWIMVASGLEGDAIYVNPTRLAIHFVSALGLISYAFWFALQLSVPPKERINDPALRKWVYAILTVLFFQLIYGALMAGLKAATAAPTWPDINGSLVPGNLFYERPLILNFVENKSTIHFIHRMLAYLLLILISVFAYKTSRVSYAANYFNKARIMVLVLVIVQVLLGISSVLTSVSSVPGKWGVFEWLAQLHQVIGMLLLLNLVAVLYLLTKKSAGTAQ